MICVEQGSGYILEEYVLNLKLGQCKKTTIFKSQMDLP